MLLRVLALMALVGCDGDSELPACGDVDVSRATIVASRTTGMIHDVTDGIDVDLISAPQGGHILLVGARVPIARDCQVDATGALRDPMTGRVIGLEQRPLVLMRGRDGFGTPPEGLAGMPNVAVCPSAAATRNIFDETYVLEVNLASDSGEALVSLSATIRPVCLTAFCRADCAPVP